MALPMNCFVNLKFFACFLLQFLFCNADFARSVKSEILCSNYSQNVVHSEATGSNDTLHYLFSTYGVPTVFVAKTDPQAQLSVDCSSLFGNGTADNSISIKPPPEYSYALVFNRLLEYKDTKDKATLTDAPKDLEFWRVYELQDVEWRTHQVNHSQIVFRVDEASHHLPFLPNGSLSLTFQLFDTSGRDTMLPRLEYTPESTQIDFTLDHLNVSFSHARFAIEMMMVTMDNGSVTELKEHRTVDDEFTPGVFKMIDWTTPAASEGEGAYVQWKPVFYNKPEKSVTTVSKATNYPRVKVKQVDLPQDLKILQGYYGNLLNPGSLLIEATNVSFGLPKKYYTHTNYLTWTASLGYGTPPSDKISTGIIIAIAIGLGIPVLMLVFGGVCMCLRRERDKRLEVDFSSSYTQVN